MDQLDNHFSPVTDFIQKNNPESDRKLSKWHFKFVMLSYLIINVMYKTLFYVLFTLFFGFCMTFMQKKCVICSLLYDRIKPN